MSEKHLRKTQVRTADRERRRAQRESKEKLIWQIPLAAVALVAVLAVAYYAVAASAQPPTTGSAGSSGPHFQADTEMLDLGDEPLGKTVHASFDIKNTGDGPLTLNAAQVATVLEGC
jgi:hypothetical protein